MGDQESGEDRRTRELQPLGEFWCGRHSADPVFDRDTERGRILRRIEESGRCFAVVGPAGPGPSQVEARDALHPAAVPSFVKQFSTPGSRDCPRRPHSRLGDRSGFPAPENRHQPGGFSSLGRERTERRFETGGVGAGGELSGP